VAGNEDEIEEEKMQVNDTISRNDLTDLLK
jgi:hypothetical protein